MPARRPWIEGAGYCRVREADLSRFDGMIQVLGCDYLDPSMATDGDLKDKLESFPESLEAAQG